MLQDTNFSLPQYPPEKWMSFIPDNIPVSNLKIPGTHDSGTGCVPYNKIMNKMISFAAQCQDLDIPTQFQHGIRYIDVRLKCEKNGDLYFYHKILKYNVTFSDILNEISKFFDKNPSECILMRLHREDGDPGSKYHNDKISDEYFIDNVVKNLTEFSDRERQKRINEREQMRPNSNRNNENENSIEEDSDDEYLSAVYNEEDDNPVLGKIRRKIMLFGIFHIADTELLESAPFKFHKIFKQAEYKLKCNEEDINEKIEYIKDGFQKSKSEEFKNYLFVNEVSALGSIRFLSFIPNPRKMAEIMNTKIESILIQLNKDKKRILNSSENNNNEDENNNENIIDDCENDFQGVLMFDFPEISKEKKLIELVYSLNAFL